MFHAEGLLLLLQLSEHGGQVQILIRRDLYARFAAVYAAFPSDKGIARFGDSGYRNRDILEVNALPGFWIADSRRFRNNIQGIDPDKPCLQVTGKGDCDSSRQLEVIGNHTPYVFMTVFRPDPHFIDVLLPFLHCSPGVAPSLLMSCDFRFQNRLELVNQSDDPLQRERAVEVIRKGIDELSPECAVPNSPLKSGPRLPVACSSELKSPAVPWA